MTTQYSAFTGYSPEISAELLIHGERFNVGSLGPDELIVRAPRPIKPGPGTVRLTVDGRVTLYHIDLFNGIDPTRVDQPYKLLSTFEEAAA